jgi:membrane-bound ClpP family serine protease
LAGGAEVTVRRERWVLVRYTLFQIPDVILLGLALAAAVRWWGLPEVTAFWILGFWVVKDIALYPLMRIAYQTGDRGASDRLTGGIAEVRQTLDPSGWVLIGGERWAAELAAGLESVAVGARVRVVSVRGLTLVVESVPTMPMAAGPAPAS